MQWLFLPLKSFFRTTFTILFPALGHCWFLICELDYRINRHIWILPSVCLWHEPYNPQQTSCAVCFIQGSSPLDGMRWWDMSCWPQPCEDDWDSNPVIRVSVPAPSCRHPSETQWQQSKDLIWPNPWQLLNMTRTTKPVLSPVLIHIIAKVTFFCYS